MAYKSLQHFINILEEHNELIRIKEFIDPDLEITEITDRISKMPGGGKALLFENTGTDFPLLINTFGSDKRMALALGVDNLDDIAKEIETLFKKLSSPKQGIFEKLQMLPELGKIAAYMPKSISRRGKSQEIVQKNPDLNKFPILKCWPADGGKFITLPMVITIDPITGIRNVGMYRMQIFDKNLTGMHWHKHKVGARHFKEYKKQGKKMPIAVALGGDPVLSYAATAPIPDHMDEFMLAGFLSKHKIKLVKAITQDIEVPADADIIIEGYIDPEEDFILEGPFGDHTGFYSLADYFPKFHVTCITHRKNAIYIATIVGIPPQEDAYIGKATERIFLAPIRLTMIPELKDMDLPIYGVAHNLTIVSIEKSFAGQAQKVMNALWGAGQMMFNKVLVIVNHDVDVHNYNSVYQAFKQNVTITQDLHYSIGPLDILDHSASKYAFGSKLCIDATRKYPEEKNNMPKAKINSIEGYDEITGIKNKFNFIKETRIGVQEKDPTVVFISIIKDSKNQIKNFVDTLSHLNDFANTELVLFFDEDVNLSDIESAVWLLTGNIDPKRDSYFVNNEVCQFVAIDGTRKFAETDNFERDWPNVIASDQQTIKKIDEIWNQLGIGSFVTSPSDYYRSLIKNKGAIAKKS